MTPHEIKTELYRQKIKMAEIGRSLGVTLQAVDRTIRGYNKSPRIRKRVSEKLNIPYFDIWPGGDGGTAHCHPAGVQQEAA